MYTSEISDNEFEINDIDAVIWKCAKKCEKNCLAAHAFNWLS